MADWTGLEPATSGVTGQHSNQLNYQSANLCGAGTRSRTRDLLITNQLLYQLSYASTIFFKAFASICCNANFRLASQAVAKLGQKRKQLAKNRTPL